MVVKGAPEAVLGLLAPCEAGHAGAARAAADAMARRALRVLGFAVVDGAALDAPDSFDSLRGRARVLGLVGQIDPPG